MSKVIVTILILVGCVSAQVKAPIPEQTILNRMFYEFLDEANKREIVLPLLHNFKGLHVSVLLLPDSVLGLCDPFSGVVLINSQAFALDAWNLRLTVFHELFHCLGDLPHDDSGVMKGALDFELSREYWQAYLTEEFARVGKESVIKDILESGQVPDITK